MAPFLFTKNYFIVSLDINFYTASRQIIGKWHNFHINMINRLITMVALSFSFTCMACMLNKHFVYKGAGYALLVNAICSIGSVLNLKFFMYLK